MPGFVSTHRAALLGSALIAAAFAGRSPADTLPGPHSLAEAIKMEQDDGLPRTAFYATPTLSDSKPGALLRQEPFGGYSIPAGAKAIRILYHSSSSTGADVATSAVVLIPAGQAPAGGWPVIAWSHGTSGVARMCAPSLQKDMEYGEEGLMPMVRAGFAVVATDYHGLGTDGPHEYVNKIAQARDVIYSVPAARAAVPSLGRRWVVIGHSQGGLAAWSVAEMEATLHDPDYLGAVSVAGAADLKAVLTGMGDPGSDAGFYLTYMAYAIHVQSPDFKASDMLQGGTLARYENATTRGCWNYAYASFLDLPPGKVVKPGWDKTAAAQKFFQTDELGVAPIGGPMLVIAGEGDQTVPIASVRATVQKACRNGIALRFRSYQGLDHDPTMDQSTPDQLAWVKDRFAGKPSTGNCAEFKP
jgi:pimeloyl-ACP methyl ester carboxylesterase